MKQNFPWILKTITAILGSLTLLLYTLYRFFPVGILQSLAITFGTTFYHFVMRLLVGAVVPGWIPPGTANNIWFREKGFEAKLYKFLRVKQWKKRIPTYNPESFDPGKHSFAEILHTGCCSEAVHEGIMVLSFLPVLTIPIFGVPGVFWITSILAALFDCCFVILQRYNRPRLIRILEKERRPL